MKIKFTPEQERFLKCFQLTKTDKQIPYRYIPLWFFETGDDGIYEIKSFVDLPNVTIEIKEADEP
jgi:hypothetical protein